MSRSLHCELGPRAGNKRVAVDVDRVGLMFSEPTACLADPLSRKSSGVDYEKQTAGYQAAIQGWRRRRGSCRSGALGLFSGGRLVGAQAGVVQAQWVGRVFRCCEEPLVLEF